MDGLERAPVQPVQALPSFVAHVNHSHFSEHPQVLGHLWLSQPEQVHQVVHGALPAGEDVQDLSPTELGHRVERAPPAKPTTQAFALIGTGCHHGSIKAPSFVAGSGYNGWPLSIGGAAPYSASLTWSPHVAAVAFVVDLEHREVCHEARLRRAMPVILARLEEDPVARADHLDRAAAPLR